MNVNYEYFVEYVRSLPHAQSLRILDYGCGGGAIVAALREAGFDAVGCEAFYEEGHSHGGKAGGQFEQLLAEGRIVAIDESGDSLPWAAGTFDLILANMVFEHVQDFDLTIRRMASVLASDGHMVLHFPTREVWREGHFGIPFSHRFSPGSSSRRSYTLALRRLGMGYHKDGMPADEWTDRALDWNDRYTIYRPYSEIRASLDREWDVTHNEFQYIRFTAERTPAPLRWVLSRQVRAAFLERVFRKLGFDALALKRKTRIPASR
jgi:SAM-dependent methyltransferase